MRVLVTGGAGFIGSQVARDLLDKGYDVVVLDDLSTGTEANIESALASAPKKIRFIKGSIRDAKTLDGALECCGAVLHLAVSNLRLSLGRPELSDEVNSSGTLSVLEACRRRKVERFVYCSSSEVYGGCAAVAIDETKATRPTTAYAASKLAGEHYALSYSRMHGMNVTVVRPFNTYGPRSHFERENGEIIPRSVVRLLNGLPPVIFGDGSQTRDFTYVGDTSRALIAVLEARDADGEVFNFGGGHELSIRALCEKLCALLAPGVQPVILGKNRPGDLARLACDARVIEKRYGLRADVGLDKGLALYLDWFRAQNYDAKALLRAVPDLNWSENS